MRAFTIITVVIALFLVGEVFVLAGYRRPLRPGHEESERHEAVERMLERMSGAHHEGTHAEHER